MKTSTSTQGEGGGMAGSSVRAEYLVGISVILSAFLISLALYFGMAGIAQGVSTLGENVNAGFSAKTGGAAVAGGPLPALEKEVTIDFLYADWCPHCQRMKPIVQALEAKLPKDRFEVRYWSEADAQSGGKAAEVFAEYGKKGIFSGYPTFVMNNGQGNKAGEMTEAEMLSWICEEFGAPKPAGC